MSKLNWFKHLRDMANDRRLSHLIYKEGAKGYGMYWYIIEMLYMQPDEKLSFTQLRTMTRKGFGKAYMAKIVCDYELFSIADGYFTSVIDYGSTGKPAFVTPKAEETPLKDEENLPKSQEPSAKAEENLPKAQERPAKSEEIPAKDEKKTAKNEAKLLQTEPEPDANRTQTEREPNANQFGSEETWSKNDFPKTGHNALINSDSGGKLALAYVREDKRREDKRRTEQTPPLTPPSVAVVEEELLPGDEMPRRIEHWRKYVEEMTQGEVWFESICMKCGYGDLLRRYTREAVAEFIRHIVLFDNCQSILSLHDARRYFANFTRAGQRTSNELCNHLMTLDKQRQAAKLNPYRFEQLIEGKRTYMGCLIPQDAPPRPNERSIWNEQTKRWINPRR